MKSVIVWMKLSPNMRRAAIGHFTKGKLARFPLDDVLERLRREWRRPALRQMFLEIQIQAAYADGRLGLEKERLLLHICNCLDILEDRFRHLERLQQTFAAGSREDAGRTSHRPAAEESTLDWAYAVLGVRPGPRTRRSKRLPPFARSAPPRQARIQRTPGRDDEACCREDARDSAGL